MANRRFVPNFLVLDILLSIFKLFKSVFKQSILLFVILTFILTIDQSFVGIRQVTDMYVATISSARIIVYVLIASKLLDTMITKLLPINLPDVMVIKVPYTSLFAYNISLWSFQDTYRAYMADPATADSRIHTTSLMIMIAFLLMLAMSALANVTSKSIFKHHFDKLTLIAKSEIYNSRVPVTINVYKTKFSKISQTIEHFELTDSNVTEIPSKGDDSNEDSKSTEL